MGLGAPEDLVSPEKKKVWHHRRVAAFKDVKILDEAGKRLGPGEDGEIVVKGYSTALAISTIAAPLPRSRRGVPYRGPGRVDADGYLYITGRKKELVKRGGVLISPRRLLTG